MIECEHMNIGVFDSGIGGQAIADSLANLLPGSVIQVVNDHNNMPYGDKQPNEIIKLTKQAIKPLIDSGCNIIVIACNTATTIAIDSLRTAHPNINFIGIEPMVKPAALITRTGHIAVCATPRTLKSDRYQKLKKTWAKDINIVEPDCKNWASLIENGHSDKIEIKALVKSLINKNVDTIVLGCTHYHWIKERIVDAAGVNMTVLEPSDAIADRIKSIANPVCSQKQ